MLPHLSTPSLYHSTCSPCHIFTLLFFLTSTCRCLILSPPLPITFSFALIVQQFLALFLPLLPLLFPQFTLPTHSHSLISSPSPLLPSYTPSPSPNQQLNSFILPHFSPYIIHSLFPLAPPLSSPSLLPQPSHFISFFHNHHISHTYLSNSSFPARPNHNHQHRHNHHHHLPHHHKILSSLQLRKRLDP